MSDARTLLIQIQAQCLLGLAALEDEHEGNLNKAVTFIEYDTMKLSTLVRTW